MPQALAKGNDGEVAQRQALQYVSGLDQQVRGIDGMADHGVGAAGFQARSAATKPKDRQAAQNWIWPSPNS